LEPKRGKQRAGETLEFFLSLSGTFVHPPSPRILDLFTNVGNRLLEFKVALSDKASRKELRKFSSGKS